MNFDTPPSESEEPELNITPMVDLVFNLLAFFVLTAVFGSERDLAAGADRPTQESAASQPGDLPDRIVIRLVPAEGSGVSLTLGQAGLGIDAFDAVTAKLGEINMPGMPVVIAADRRVGVQQVARVMDAVLSSPMKRVSLSQLDR